MGRPLQCGKPALLRQTLTLFSSAAPKKGNPESSSLIYVKQHLR